MKTWLPSGIKLELSKTFLRAAPSQMRQNYLLRADYLPSTSLFGRPLRAAEKRRKKTQSLVTVKGNGEFSIICSTDCTIQVCAHMQAFKYGILAILV